MQMLHFLKVSVSKGKHFASCKTLVTEYLKGCFFFLKLIPYSLSSLENVSFKCQKSIADRKPRILHQDLLL